MPSKTLLRPGEALQGAREAPGARRGRRRRRATPSRPSPGATSWSRATTTPARSAGTRARASTSSAAAGGSTGPGGSSVDGAAYTAERHRDLDRLRRRSSRRSPGLRELDGVWTNREATGLKEVPRRLLVLGGGPVGVEMAQVVARMGGEVALVEGMPTTCSRASPSRSARRSARRWRPTASSSASASTPRRSAARAASYVLEFPERDELRGDRLLVATGRRPRVEGIGLENVGIEPGKRGIEVDARMNAGDGVWAIGDVTGIWPLDLRRQVPGPGRRRQHPRAPSARPTTTPCRGSSSPIRRPPRSARPRGRSTVTVPLVGGPADLHLHARVRRQAGLHDARLRRRAR